MGKGSSDAPSPDPRIGEAAVMQQKTGADWLQFAKDQFKISTARQGEVDKLAKRVTEQQLGVADEVLKQGREDRTRYKKTFQPIEDQFVAEAKEAGSVRQQQARASEAGADVSTAAAAARETARREASAVGIRPGSGRYSGIERAGELGTALGRATAENQARGAERARGTAMRGAAIDLGNTTIGRSSANLQLGLNAGSSAYGVAGQNQQLAMAPAQNMNTGYEGMLRGVTGQANTLSNLYGMQLDAWGKEQEMKSNEIGGLASGIGSIAGMFSFASDKKVKKNVKSVKKGAGLKAVKGMPVKKFDYKDGAGDGGKGHVGTMAQDFKRETGSGDGKSIAYQDAIGITMKAVQDLDEKVDKMGKQLGVKAPQPRRKTKTKARRKDDGPKKAKPYKPPKKPSQQLGLG